MTVFPGKQATFTLLDIHQECIDSASSLENALGPSSHLDGAVCGDATNYEISAGRKPDVIVSETMAVCLHNEPQVAITRHLLTQAMEARIVPQSVSVEVCMLDWAKEHVLMPADYVGEFPAVKRDRIHDALPATAKGNGPVAWLETGR
jgi:predicted RNA methylase